MLKPGRARAQVLSRVPSPPPGIEGIVAADRVDIQVLQMQHLIANSGLAFSRRPFLSGQAIRRALSPITCRRRRHAF